MSDVSPALLEKVEQAFAKEVKADPKLKQLDNKITKGTATYEDAGDYAEQIGQALVKAFKTIDASDLPNRHMYWNISEAVVDPMLRKGYGISADFCQGVQKILSDKYNIGTAPKVPKISQKHIKAIMDYLDATEDFDDARWMLEEPVITTVRTSVDDSVKKNATAMYEAGLKPRVVRIAESKCCDWCNSVAGVYEYPDVPSDVYKRHNNCRCTVTYYPGTGKKQNVWESHQRWQDADPVAIQARSKVADEREARRKK